MIELDNAINKRLVRQMNIENLNELNKMTIAELEKTIAEAQARIEELKCEPWTPKDGDKVWIVFSDGDACKRDYKPPQYEKCYLMGLVFRTEADTQLKADSMQARQRVRQWIARENAKLNWVADFSDRKQDKCFLDYSHQDKKWSINWCSFIQRLPIKDYFAPELRHKILEAFTAEELALAYLEVRL